MMIIPLKAVESQSLQVTLANQICRIDVYQKSTGLFLDLYVDSTLIMGGIICQNLNGLIRSKYLNFVGELAFIDNQGTTDPFWTGLGARYSLAYLEQTDAGLA